MSHPSLVGDPHPAPGSRKTLQEELGLSAMLRAHRRADACGDLEHQLEVKKQEHMQQLEEPITAELPSYARPSMLLCDEIEHRPQRVVPRAKALQKLEKGLQKKQVHALTQMMWTEQSMEKKRTSTNLQDQLQYKAYKRGEAEERGDQALEQNMRWNRASERVHSKDAGDALFYVHPDGGRHDENMEKVAQSKHEDQWQLETEIMMEVLQRIGLSKKDPNAVPPPLRADFYMRQHSEGTKEELGMANRFTPENRARQSYHHEMSQRHVDPPSILRQGADRRAPIPGPREQTSPPPPPPVRTSRKTSRSPSGSPRSKKKTALSNGDKF